MASAPVLDLVSNNTASAGDIVAVVSQNPGLVLLDTEKYSVWYEGLKARGSAIPVDVASKKGRDALRSFAADVRSEKAGIKKARLRLTEEWRSMTAQANAAGKIIDEQLEALATEVRAPLTEWELAEEARVAACRATIAEMQTAKVIAEEDTAATVRARGSLVYATEIDAARFGDMLGEAESVKADAIATLKRALLRLTQEEADRAELAKLRAEREEHDRLAAEREAAAAAEREKAEVERAAEERRIAAERADAERIARVQEAAAQAARDQADREAREAQDARNRAHQEELAAERAKAAEAERLRQAEIARVAEVERQRAEQEAKQRAEAKRLADEQAEREKNKAHRTRVKTAAKQAIMTCGCDEATAQKIVLAIIAGEIPAVTLGF